MIWPRIVLVLICAFSLVALPSAQGRQQPPTVTELVTGDWDERVDALEALRRRTPATTSFEAKAQLIGDPLFQYYTMFAAAAKPADLPEIDARARAVHAWMAVGAPNAWDMDAIWIEYFINSHRPGLALKALDTLDVHTNLTRTQSLAQKLYAAWAYAELGLIQESMVALSQVSEFSGVPREEYDQLVGLFANVGMRVFDSNGQSGGLDYYWRVTERLFERDAMHDLQFLRLAVTGRNAAMSLGEAAVEAKARAATARYMDIVFASAGSTVNDCSRFLTANFEAEAQDPHFTSRFATCLAELRASDSARIPSDFLFSGARVFELQRDYARAGDLFFQAAVQNEQARSSIDLTYRETFFQGLHRRAVHGAVRNYAHAALRDPSASALFFAGLAAGDAMRARQLSDFRGDTRLLSAQELERFARTLPDGVVVAAISTLDKERVAFTFSNAERHVGLGVNLPLGSDSGWGDTLVRFMRDPSVDVQGVIAPYMKSAPAVLLGPGRHMLRSARRVIVLADGAAARVPAAVWSSDDLTYRPLGETAEIIYTPSLRDLLAPPRSVSRARGFFAIGNPTMPAIPTPPGLTPQQAREMGASAGATRDRNGGVTLQQLDNAEFEVRDIARGFLPDVQMLFEGAASERAVKAASLSQRRYLHFATHGLLAGDFAGLAEPALVLAPGDGEDGFLLASEVQALKLDADLTVLSACNTGSGRTIAGEGVIGLSRAFLVAGSRAVLASLWPVDDATTEIFMSGFYERLRAGAPPSRALKETAAAIRAEKSHPKFWAPFVLVSAEGSAWRS